MLSFKIYLKLSVTLRNQINPVTQNRTTNKHGSTRVKDLALTEEWTTSISRGRMPGMAGHSSHTGSMSDVGHLASGQNSKQRKGPSNGVHWINLSMSCALRHPASPDPNLHSQDKYLCHHSPSVPGHKFNLSSIILVQRYNFPPPNNVFKTSEQARDETSLLNMTKHFGNPDFFLWLLFV